jgi:ER membrane protein complex subunit 1
MWLQAVLLLTSCAPLALAIFADEVNHVDFHHALLGKPSAPTTFFHRPSSSSNASLLYTLSDKSFLGAVNPKDGSIVWRQNLARWSSDATAVRSFLRAGDGQNTIVSALGGCVSSWGALDGKLSWMRHFGNGPVRDLELLEHEGSNSLDVITLAGDKTGIIRRLDGDSGSTKWGFQDERLHSRLRSIVKPH